MRTSHLIPIVLVCLAIPAAHAAPWRVPADLEPLPATIRTPESTADDTVVPCVLRKIPLGDVSFHAKGGGLADTFVSFSPDGNLLAIGTFEGRVQVVDIYTGETLWKKRIPEGAVKNVAFSADGQQLFYGEQSPDGNVAAVDARTGAARWSFRLADDLESGAPPSKDNLYWLFQLPGSFRLIALDNGDVLVLGLHSWGDHAQTGSVKRWSRIYRFNRRGEQIWAYPHDGPLPMSLIYMDADRQGRRVAALATDAGANAPEDGEFPTGALHVIDGETGKPVGRYVFPPLNPHFDRVWFWHSVSVGPEGRRAAVGAYDGRSFLMDLDTVTPAHEFRFGAPVMMGAIPVSAGATCARIAPDGTAYFQTGVSSVPGGAAGGSVTTPPGPHPNANTLNAVDSTGKVRWRYRGGHTFQNIWFSADGRWLLASTERSGDDGEDSGAMLFDTSRPGGGSRKLVYYYPLEGKAFFNAAMSPDGGAIAIVETPVVDRESGMLRGTYQVHVVR